MLFEKVNKEHIIQGIKDFEEKGLPNGFGASSTYDLVFEDKKYPPKAIMAYANFYAAGRKIESYFKGGVETDCFNAYDRNGFEVVKKDKVMINYKNYEKTVYNWLSKKNELDDNFTFSLRQKGSKGAELDYFIGTEKSRYFAVTFWSIPVAYPGSSSDCIDLIFKVSKDYKKYSYDFKFTQTNSPDNKQNKSVLNLLKSLTKPIVEEIGASYISDSSNKMFTVRTKPNKENYVILDVMLKDIGVDLLKLIPIINNQIEEEKKLNPEFEANRISKEDFANMEAKLLVRFDKYGVVNDTVKNEISEEKVNQLDYKPSKNKNNPAPTNQILYGPPGTGKTFYLKDQLFDKYTLRENAITKEKFFENKITNLTWWQVIAIALIENGTSKVNDILDNRWVKTKASLSESKNVRATIWGTLQMHTIISSENVAYKQRQNPLIFDKDNDKMWQLLEEETKEQIPEIFDVIDEINNFKKNNETVIKNYDFVTFHQSFAYEDFIEGIKPVFPKEEVEVSDLGYTIEDGVFKNLCAKAKNDPSNRYAIFIDEINRGNVSAIFGELITLIETDKRSGSKNEMSIKLPYSKTAFSVPSNLDIYGTMNTADRSVEALDTALRRRFEFKEIMPKPNLLKIQIEGINLKELLETINKRIEVLLDRDHTIGHSYFIKLEENDILGLKNTFKNNIIPLLQEYFYGDYEKIGLVLGKGFFNEKALSFDKDIFASFDTQNYPEKGKIFNLKTIDEDFDIINAINILLKKTSENE
ncbi:AAA family ATPase [uncultured Polaribacter sp.]|uniref:AAA family ATPase n=1 Tax=uncultured Polaribacter sp. TaxID=174711 RepID=UPI00262777C8|nr:AAA family ATPase [uncultured Polaribacter sp.]